MESSDGLRLEQIGPELNVDRGEELGVEMLNNLEGPAEPIDEALTKVIQTREVMRSVDTQSDRFEQ